MKSPISEVLSVIPEAEINLVTQGGQRRSRENWWWGMRVLLWQNITMRSGLACTKTEVREALESVCGIPERTLRHYADHAAFFPLEVWEAYMVLPFSHFVIAKRFGDRWREVLDTSLEFFEKRGRFPTTKWLEWRFSRNTEPTIEANEKLEQVTDEMVESMKSATDEIFSEEHPIEKSDPAASTFLLHEWMHRVSVSLENLEKSLIYIPISKETKERVKKAIENMEEELQKAIEEITTSRA